MLIDRDKTYEVLTDYYHHKTGMQHEVLQDALSKVPVEDAIPIEWLERWVKSMPKDSEYLIAPKALVENLINQWLWEEENATN